MSDDDRIEFTVHSDNTIFTKGKPDPEERERIRMLIESLPNASITFKGNMTEEGAKLVEDMAYSVVRCVTCGIVRRSHEPSDHKYIPDPRDMDPQHIHEDDGTFEGCPGCFPDTENEIISATIRSGSSDLEIVNEVIRVAGYDRVMGIAAMLSARYAYVYPESKLDTAKLGKLSREERRRALLDKFAPPQPSDPARRQTEQ